MNYPIDSYDIEKNGKQYRVKVFADECMRAPWKEFDGHGIVSDWETRDKLPSEKVLNVDRYYKRFYDFAESVKIAKRDGCGLSPDELQKLESKLGRKATKNEIAVKAVENDFAYLKAWCNDEWQYVVITVTLLHSDGMPSAKDACIGGIEYGYQDSDNQDEYIDEVIADLISEIESQ